MSRMRFFDGVIGAALVLLSSGILQAADETKIVEVAPGVHFRKAQTSPIFTGCNQGWIIFKDFVLIIDANFPGQADEVLASIRKTTDKPIRFVFDTHYHGDHADGNMQYTKLGATIIAQERSQALFESKGREGFTRAQTDRATEYGGLSYALPSLYFSHKLIFDDGEQRVELLFLGHGHTAGDAVAWLPKHRILFTGDACVNGPFNYTGDSQTETWIAALAAMEELGVKTLCPGHGEMGGPEVIANQKKYFVELRSEVQKAIQAGKNLDQVKKEISIPFYQEWTGVDAKTRTENIEHVFKELSAARPSVKDSAAFRRWESLSQVGGYTHTNSLEKLGQHPVDLAWQALADLYLVSDSIHRREVRSYFDGRTEDLQSMGQYIFREAAQLAKTGNEIHLRRGLAIAAIEGGRRDYRETLQGLAILRYVAEQHEVDAKPYFAQIKDWVAIENWPLFEQVRGQSQDSLAQAAKEFRSSLEQQP